MNTIKNIDHAILSHVMEYGSQSAANIAEALHDRNKSTITATISKLCRAEDNLLEYVNGEVTLTEEGIALLKSEYTVKQRRSSPKNIIKKKGAKRARKPKEPEQEIDLSGGANAVLDSVGHLISENQKLRAALKEMKETITVLLGE